MTATKEIKYSFEAGGRPLDEQTLMRAIREETHKFPHVSEGEWPGVKGRMGETGVVAYGNGTGLIFGAVRHPSFIPREINGHGVEYQGPQTLKHLERSFLVEHTDEYVARHASGMLQVLGLPGARLSDLAEFYEGAGAGGSEPEAWLVSKDGTPYHIDDGGELQDNLLEETLDAVSDPSVFLRTRARQIKARKEKYPEATVVDTSSMPTGSPAEMRVLESGEIGPYVKAIQNILYSRFMHAYHPLARGLMDKIADAYHYRDWQDMHGSLGNMAYLVFSASHLSIGLPHLRKGNEAMSIPEQEAIAVADIFNSNLATLAELLMFSTPMVYGITPTVNVDGQELWPRDMRSIMRYALDTTYPAPFIMTPANYRRRVSDQIVNGLSHTIDRAAYMTEIPDLQNGGYTKRAVMHGRVRIRAASNEPRNLTGRVEFTGCSASPSIWDEAARNSLLQLLMVGAYEALANGQHPADYFGGEFPNLAEWKDQQALAIEASLYGFRTPRIMSLIGEGIRFVDRMQDKYLTRENGHGPVSALGTQARLARERLLNLQAPPAQSLGDYVDSPRGPFSEVVRNELMGGKTPLEVTREIESYQLAMADKLLR